MPHGRRRAEAHGVVEPQCYTTACSREEGAAVRRLPDRPLPVCIEQVVAEDQHFATVRHEAECHVGEIVDILMRWGIGRRHRGVVVGSAPALAPAKFEVAVLVRLQDRKREGDEDVAWWLVNQAVGPLTKGTAAVLVVQKASALAGPITRPKRAFSRARPEVCA